MILKKMIPLWVLLLITCTITVCAMVIHTLTIPVTVKFRNVVEEGGKGKDDVTVVKYGLQLRRANGEAISGLNFGEFDDNEAKWSETLQLHNIGNIEVIVYHYNDAPKEWRCELYDASGEVWREQEGKTLEVEDYIELKILVQEVNATRGESYNFNIVFEVKE